jgi:hypothetical protein
MIKLYENEIKKAWLNMISQEMIEAMANNGLSFEGGNDHYGNSYGQGGMVQGDRLLEYFTPIIEKDFGCKIAKENSYSRIYFNGSTLKPHIDRPGLDITLSLCAYSDIETEWPLCVHDGQQVHILATPPGTAAAMLGTKHVHWRDPLVCRDDQKVIQVFCHWRILS